MILLLFLLGITGGFLAGLLGVGGAMILVPLMLTLPPLFGFEPLSMKTVTGLSILQIFFSSISGLIIHKKNGFVHLRTLLFIAIPMGFSSFAGAYLSKYLDDTVLLVIFELLVVAALLLFIRKEPLPVGSVSESTTYGTPLPVISTGIVVGAVAGMAGAGGGFILIPVMISLLKIPLKTAIGTSSGIVLIGALTGGIGKLISLQTDVKLALPLVLGSVISANMGAVVSRRCPSRVLRMILIAMIVASGIQIAFRFF